MKSWIINLSYTILFFIITWDLFSCKQFKNNFISFTNDEEITTITSDNETQFINAIEELNKNGGTIYVDTPIINLKERNRLAITGKSPGGIIGIKQSNGEYPRINFIEKNREFLSGINIYGSNKFIEYIIIENSPNYGISIIGDNNILDHVISRYNFGSGFNIYGDFNTLNYCYSYRNCDRNMKIGNSDGFTIIGELNNVFKYCFAWDNGNSGFNYVRMLNSSELSYLHCGSWNNGNVGVFTGIYDYESGNPLDKNLWSIQEIIESDPNYVNNYYNGKFNYEYAELEGMSVKMWIATVGFEINGDGFTFGNKNSSQSIEVKRNALYCISFDHYSGGFLDNFNHKYNAYITNCVSFNNGINYKLPYIFSKWSNNWSWGSYNKDKLNKVTTKKPSNINTAERLIYSVRNQIVKVVSANMFPDGVNFDSAIDRLTE